MCAHTHALHYFLDIIYATLSLSLYIYICLCATSYAYITYLAVSFDYVSSTLAASRAHFVRAAPLSWHLPVLHVPELHTPRSYIPVGNPQIKTWDLRGLDSSLTQACFSSMRVSFAAPLIEQTQRHLRWDSNKLLLPLCM